MNSADGSGQTPLTTDTNADTLPDWSSDNVIVFTSNRMGDNDLFVINADGSGETQLTFDDSNDSFAVWSPDGSQILYATNLATDGSGGLASFNIYAINPDGTGQAPVTTETSNNTLPGIK
jgi:TolB protein